MLLLVVGAHIGVHDAPTRTCGRDLRYVYAEAGGKTASARSVTALHRQRRGVRHVVATRLPVMVKRRLGRGSLLRLWRFFALGQ